MGNVAIAHCTPEACESEKYAARPSRWQSVRLAATNVRDCHSSRATWKWSPLACCSQRTTIFRTALRLLAGRLCLVAHRRARHAIARVTQQPHPAGYGAQQFQVERWAAVFSVLRNSSSRACACSPEPFRAYLSSCCCTVVRCLLDPRLHVLSFAFLVLLA